MTRGGANPRVVLGVAGVGYLLAVSQRSTLGAAALVATDRFHISGEQLALLAVAQLGVYALMQIPVGVLLDRFGSRRLLAIGAALMAFGQIAVALANSFELAAVGRLAVGLGDAFTFISLIRLVNGWFEGPTAARLQQLLGNIGQLGQVVSAFPFALLLNTVGWTSAFLAWASVSVLTSALIWILVTDERFMHASSDDQLSLREAWRQLGVNLRSPAVRMAFWTHFVIQSPGTVMVLLWGMPFLVSAEQLDRSVAATLLSMFVVVGIIFGVFYGYICAHHPRFRVGLVLLLFSLTASYWGWVLSFESVAPLPVLFGLFFILGVSGPGSMLAFDFSRTTVPKSRLGSANGFINIGGFLASFSMMWAIGVVLDVHNRLQPEDALYSLAGFRVALLAQFVVLGIGIAMFLREARASKSHQLVAAE